MTIFNPRTGDVLRGEHLGQHEDLTVSDSVVALDPDQFPDSDSGDRVHTKLEVLEVLIQETVGQPLRLTANGTDPTTTCGIVLNGFGTITLGIDPAKLKFIRAGGADAIIAVSFFGGAKY